jgi:NADH dehydrogenase
MRVAILGGGFGGLYLARSLARRARPGALRIALVDRGERFVFKPLLYELLTGEVDEDDIAPRFADVIDPARIDFVQAEVRSIDLAARRVILAGTAGPPALEWDALAIALGAEPHHHGLPGLEGRALYAATIEDFRRIRARVANLLSRPDLARQGPLRRVAICGAGPSGIEIALKLADVPGAKVLEITVVEASGEILRGFGEELKAVARAALGAKGIELRLSAPVVAADESGLALAGGRIEAATLIWTAGQRPVEAVRALPVERDPLGRVIVGATLELPGHPGVFALGDAAKCVIEGAVAPPATAQVAVQQASVVARNVLARLEGRTLGSYRYLPLAETLSLGRGADAFHILGLQLGGRLGHAARRLAYLARLPSSRHRAKVAARWGARLAAEAVAGAVRWALGADRSEEKSAKS